MTCDYSILDKPKKAFSTRRDSPGVSTLSLFKLEMQPQYMVVLFSTIFKSSSSLVSWESLLVVTVTTKVIYITLTHLFMSLHHFHPGKITTIVNFTLSLVKSNHVYFLHDIIRLSMCNYHYCL